jgi:hypothetical protein
MVEPIDGDNHDDADQQADRDPKTKPPACMIQPCLHLAMNAAPIQWWARFGFAAAPGSGRRFASLLV